MHEILFHPAIWMPLALVFAGAGVFVYGNARIQSFTRNSGLGIVLLAIAWMVAAHFVDTFTETCINRTNAIVSAVEAQKWADLRKLLDRNTTLAGLRGAEEISQTAERYVGIAQLKEIRILNRDIQSIPGGVDVSIDTYTEARQPGTSTWTFSYEARSDGILLRQVTPIRIFGRPAEDVERIIDRLGR